MTYLGTRPPTVDEWEKYELHHRSRMSTKPGITGMWQVSGRSDITDFEEVVRLDTEYIEHWTIGLDIKILIKTVLNLDFLNENSFDFVPVFKIFINTNYLPNVNDMTLFQSGRLKIIPFNRHFEEGEQDQGLKGQFAKPENLSGIFNWCLEGYKKFCQRGLELPQAVTKATEDYKDDSDRIGQFIEAWLEKEEGSELRTAAAYQLYTKWCEENGYSSENQKNFKNAIGVHFKVVRKRPKGGGGQTTLIMDCKFKEVEAGAEDLTVQDAYKPKDSLL